MNNPIFSKLIVDRGWLLLWLLIFASTFWWRVQNLDAFGLTNDEGAYLMWSQLPLEGYPLYTETRAVQPPLFFEWVGLFLRLLGPLPAAGRWSTLVAYTLLAVSLSWLGYRARGRVAAVGVVFLLGVTPLTFTYSRLVMAEIPAITLAVLSLALLFIYLDRPYRGWLVGSGVALGVSLLIKALNPFMALLVALLLWQQARTQARWLPTLVVNGVWWGVGVLLPIILTVILYNTPAMIDQTVVFRGDLRTAIPGSWAETWGHFSLLLTTHWGLWLLALGGMVSAVVIRWRAVGLPFPRRRIKGGTPDYALLWTLWLASAIALLAWHTPLFYHHLIILLPPLILLAAGFMADVAHLLKKLVTKLQFRHQFFKKGSLPPQSQLASLTLPIGFALLIILAAFNLPTMFAADQKAVEIVTGGRETEAMAFLQAVTLPTDFVMGDSQLFIYMADRRTPPPLGDVALVAVKAGRQTSPRMIELSQTYQAAAVVQWSLRLPWLPDYLAWVEANYLARKVWDNDHIIHFAPRFPENQPIPNEQGVTLGDQLTLRGFMTDEAITATEQGLNLRVYWQTAETLDRDYTVFTQLLDQQGQLVAGRDSQPLGGMFPTSQWPAAEIVIDRVHLTLPDDLPAGEYRLITGMYLLETLERLGTVEGQDHINLTTITLVN